MRPNNKFVIQSNAADVMIYITKCDTNHKRTNIGIKLLNIAKENDKICRDELIQLHLYRAQHC